MYYVYGLLDPTTNVPFYIGKGNRCNEHLKETYQKTENRKKYNKIKSITNKNLKPIVYFYHENIENEDHAYDLEAELIKKLGRRGIDEGGILTNICIDQRPPRSQGPLSQETKDKIGNAQKGPKNHRYGKTFTPEQRKKRSELFKRLHKEGKGFTPPDHTGMKRSNETKRKMSIAAKGKPKPWITGDKNPMYGKRGSLSHLYGLKRSDETRKRISDSQQRSYEITSATGHKMFLKSAELPKFCELNDLNYKGLHAAKKKQQPHRGWLLREI